ncbi:MAG: FliH/SctL family protein [Dehalococcoidia bacterium]
MASERIRLLRGTPRGAEVVLGDDDRGAIAPGSTPIAGLDPAAPAALDDANERVLEIVEDAIRESAAIRQRAYREGYEAGQRDGQGAAHAEVANALGLVASIASDARLVRNALLRNSEADIVDLAIDVARAILGDALAIDRRAVVATVERAIERAAHMNILRIRVHPDDVEAVTAHLAETGAAAPATWQVSADGTIGVAGCVVDVEGGEVDARLDVQFDLVADALRELAATNAAAAPAGEEAGHAA